MKKIVLLVLISLLLISCNLPLVKGTQTTQSPTEQTPIVIVVTAEPPTEQPSTEVQPSATATEPPAPTFEGTELNLGGVYMVLPACLGANAEGTIIAAQPYDPNGGPTSYYPQHRSITFPGYPLSDKFFDAELRVYPVVDYIMMEASVGEQVNKLTDLLISQNPNTEDSLPFLPGFPAAQVFHAQERMLDFQNGMGVRYFTEYAQYYAPVNNYDLFYTYQGLTTDGKYWVSATFPINAAFLQEFYDDTTIPAGGIAAPSFSSATYETDMEIYYSQMIDLLNNSADDAYNPTLTCLDQYIQSLQISD